MSDQYAVIGHPIAHSRSPAIHSRFAQQTGQDLHYAAILAPLDSFAARVHEFIAAGGRGMNVTVPFKEQAFRLANRLSARAQAAGAVNTLQFSGTEIYGDNTDGAGLVRDIEHNLGCRIAGRRVLLLGAGGAARGCVLPLLEAQPAHLLIVNRTAAKAEALAQEFTAQLPQTAQAAHLSGAGLTALTSLTASPSANPTAGAAFDLIINATSAGLQDSALEIPSTLFAADCLAYEMVYGRDTPFMQLARRCGAHTADGLGMLIEQAAEAFLLWRGIRPQTAELLIEMRSA